MKFRNIHSVQQLGSREKEQINVLSQVAEPQVRGDGRSAQGRALIELRGVSKAYDVAAGKFMALRGISMQVRAGEFVAVVGKSGSGKSTLINMITGIDYPTAGEVLVASTAVHKLNQEQLAAWRGKHVGIVFQFFQ